MTPSLENRQRQTSAVHSLQGSESENPFAEPFDRHSVAPIPSGGKGKHRDNGTPSPSSSIASEVLAEAYLRLHPSPVTPGEDIGQDINPHLPPSPRPITQADATTVPDILPALPKSPAPENPESLSLAHEQDPLDKTLKSKRKYCQSLIL